MLPRKRHGSAFAAPVVTALLLACAGGTVPPERPTERCDNGRDDNGDGKADCVDPACFGHPSCGDGEFGGRPDTAERRASATGDGGGAGHPQGGGESEGGDGSVETPPLAPGPPVRLRPSDTGFAERCDDGIDNDGDRTVDCADPSCATSPRCLALPDGAPCNDDAQCAGGHCVTELASGAPNGACGNRLPCTLAADGGTDAGCHGGRCTVLGNEPPTCLAPCRAAAPSSARTAPRLPGTPLPPKPACRPGYACVDPDGDASTDDAVCAPLCSSDADCATATTALSAAPAGDALGCNPASRRCERKLRHAAGYGAPCERDADCESRACLRGADWRRGYCAGPCRADAADCAPGGVCTVASRGAGETGTCAQACASDGECRADDRLRCWSAGDATDAGACLCKPRGAGCAATAECCGELACTALWTPLWPFVRSECR